MKYAIARCTNGAYKVESEHGNLKAGRIAFRSYCNAIDNDKDFVGTATVKLLDENLDAVDGFSAVFNVAPPEPEPTPEAETPAESAEESAE
jgi:hypothetical protein